MNANKYHIILYWSDEDEAFIAEVPELPGCAADGKTYRQALRNVEVVMEEWIVTARELGRAIPKPHALYRDLTVLPEIVFDARKTGSRAGKNGSRKTARSRVSGGRRKGRVGTGR